MSRDLHQCAQLSAKIICLRKKTETDVDPPPISIHAAPNSCSSSTSAEIADWHRPMKQHPPIPNHIASHKPSRFCKTRVSMVSKCKSTDNKCPICPRGSDNDLGFDPAQNSLASHEWLHAHRQNMAHHKSRQNFANVQIFVTFPVSTST